MKALLLLAGLWPLAALANALREDGSPAPQGEPRTELRAIQERWESAPKAEAPSFRRHVIPLLAHAGCSGRECHGSFQGRGGFQLSLFGYDFDKDHEAITKGKGGAEEVRVDLQDPASSLLLAKPSLDGEEHKGKKIFAKHSWEYNLLLRWIQEGAKSDVVETGEFGSLEVLPKELLFQKPGDAIQLKVLAHWKDGTVEDVTQLTRFRTNDEAVAVVNDRGLVTSKEAGDTHIVAFYDNGVEPVPAILAVAGGGGAKLAAVKARTRVDELVNAKLIKTGIVPSEVCTDVEFLRRVSLDVTGSLPLPAEIEAFAQDSAPDKRARKIDELLARPAYAAWWATKISDFSGNNPRQIRVNTGVNGKTLGPEMSRQWYTWLYKRLGEDMPYDQLAAGIVLAVSRTAPDQSYQDFVDEMGAYFRKDHPTDFAQRENMPWFWMRQNVQKPEEKALAFAHTFLGVRIECAQCHKHPFDQWTKTDFEQFQAFFSGVASGGKTSRGLVRAANATADASALTSDKLRQEIKEKVTASLGGQPADPKGNAVRRAEQEEISRRIAAGEPVPWDELYVDVKTVGKPAKAGPKQVQGGSRVITPKILGGEQVVMANYNDPREPLMAWMRSPENPYFAKAFVNRVWAAYFSRGIVEPADDLNLANAPSNAALLSYLAEGFISHGFSIKWLHREILTSDAYQRSWKTNETNRLDEKNYSHAVIRRLPAEVVYDAITTATSSTARLAEFMSDINERAIGPNGNGVYGQNGGNAKKGGDNYALTIFGKPARESNCDCERTTDPTLLQTIYIRNDPSLLQRVEGNRSAWIEELRAATAPQAARNPAALRETLAKLDAKFAAKFPAPEKPAAEDADAMARYEQATREHEGHRAEFESRKSDLRKQLAEAEKPVTPFDLEHTIREVFLRTVSRPPSAEEFAQARVDVAAAKLPVDGVRELLWAMLNTREFMVNH